MDNWEEEAVIYSIVFVRSVAVNNNMHENNTKRTSEKETICSGYVETVVISGANKEAVTVYFISDRKSVILHLSYLAELYVS